MVCPYNVYWCEVHGRARQKQPNALVWCYLTFHPLIFRWSFVDTGVCVYVYEYTRARCVCVCMCAYV